MIDLETLAEYVATRSRYDKFEALAKGVGSPDEATRNEARIAARKAQTALDRLTEIQTIHPDVQQVATRVSAALAGHGGYAGPGPRPTGGPAGWMDLLDRFGAAVATEVASEVTGTRVKLDRGQYKILERPAADRMVSYDVSMRQEDAGSASKRARVLSALDRKLRDDA